MSFVLDLLKVVSGWLLEKLGAFFFALFSQFLAKEEIKQKADADAAELSAAKTKQDKIDAANAINRDTFS